jgi:hypothetical protein
LPLELEYLTLEDPDVFLFQRDIFDVSDIQVERKGNESKYGAFYPDSIELVIDKEGNVLVEKSKIYF